MKNNSIKYEKELIKLSDEIKNLVYNGDFETCERILREAMSKYPHAPHPHNLYGIILEKRGNHSYAMKHFRAAWALDPTYAPANHNLHAFGSFFSKGICAYDEDDVFNLNSNQKN